MCFKFNYTPTGLCGNFNHKMSDDFTGISGLVEGTAAAFANTWKTSASCSDITLTFGHPCSLSFNNGTASLSSRDYQLICTAMKVWMKIEHALFHTYSSFSSENYAQFWCSKLTDASGVFSQCHSVINPEKYKDVSLHTQLYKYSAVHTSVYKNWPWIQVLIIWAFTWR